MSGKNSEVYFRNEEGVYEWAVNYAYLRAGKLNKLYSSLSKMGSIGIELRCAASEFFQSINALEPEVQNITQSIEDPFYKQIVYILSG